MQFEFGISTHCLSSTPLSEALELLAPLTEIVEVMDDGMHYLENAEPLLSFDFEYFLHAPSRGVNLASQLEPIRKASVEVTQECFEIAGEVGATVIVHPGYYAWEKEREQAESRFATSLEELRITAEENQMDFMFENMGNWPHFFLKCPDELPLIDGQGFVLDTGHAYLNGCLDEFLTVPIDHFHLHDNKGIEDTHSAIGEGTIDFGPVLEAMERNDAMPIIEVDSLAGVMASIEALKTLYSA